MKLSPLFCARLNRRPNPPRKRIIGPANSKKRHARFIDTLTVFLVITFYPGCATISPPLPRKPFSEQQLKSLIVRIQEQENRVSSFYRICRLSVEDGYWAQDVNILIAGTKDPFRIKIEITHPWGRPIVHILVIRDRLEVLSFAEKKIYEGFFTPEALSRFFPAELDDRMIWAALRGYPTLRRYDRITSLEANQMNLFNEKGEEVETIDFYPESLHPRQVTFPEDGIDLAFSGFEEDHGIRYAKEVRMAHKRGEKKLTLRNGKMAFNKVIPDQIFALDRPPGFATFYLE
ncbi:MAG: hypothetical protein PVG99_06610 [Desulfobacteraceae bacterium]|jgi:hypothetical protein